MLRYPVKLTRDDETFLVTAPDLPEVTTFGETVEDALEHAGDAIATALQGRITDRRSIPAPSAPKGRQRLVALPAIVAAKLALYIREIAAEGERRVCHSPKRHRGLLHRGVDECR